MYDAVRKEQGHILPRYVLGLQNQGIRFHRRADQDLLSCIPAFILPLLARLWSRFARSPHEMRKERVINHRTS